MHDVVACSGELFRLLKFSKLGWAKVGEDDDGVGALLSSSVRGVMVMKRW